MIVQFLDKEALFRVTLIVIIYAQKENNILYFPILGVFISGPVGRPYTHAISFSNKSAKGYHRTREHSLVNEK